MITGIPNPNARATYTRGPAEPVKQPNEEVRNNVRLYKSNKCVRTGARAVLIFSYAIYV